MQTFVPFNDITFSAQALDNKRLNKQLLEGRQIYGILSSGKTKGAWVNHPAVKMWRCYDNGLYSYLVAIYKECVSRGIKADKNWEAIEQIHESNWNRGSNTVMPAWWGDNRVHESHRNNLYVKDSNYYIDFANANRTTCCDKCNYFWPTHLNL
mgnify:CR=1 FL=1